MPTTNSQYSWHHWLTPPRWSSYCPGCESGFDLTWPVTTYPHSHCSSYHAQPCTALISRVQEESGFAYLTWPVTTFQCPVAIHNIQTMLNLALIALSARGKSYYMPFLPIWPDQWSHFNVQWPYTIFMISCSTLLTWHCPCFPECQRKMALPNDLTSDHSSMAKSTQSLTTDITVWLISTYRMKAEL